MTCIQFVLICSLSFGSGSDVRLKPRFILKVAGSNQETRCDFGRRFFFLQTRCCGDCSRRHSPNQPQVQQSSLQTVPSLLDLPALGSQSANRDVSFLHWDIWEHKNTELVSCRVLIRSPRWRLSAPPWPVFASWEPKDLLINRNAQASGQGHSSPAGLFLLS